MWYIRCGTKGSSMDISQIRSENFKIARLKAAEFFRSPEGKKRRKELALLYIERRPSGNFKLKKNKMTHNERIVLALTLSEPFILLERKKELTFLKRISDLIEGALYEDAFREIQQRTVELEKNTQVSES